MTDDRTRYARQIALPEIGADGQRRLRSSSALVIGVGGLGHPVATYLAGAGIGRLFLSDFDAVDLSNLHRQPLFGTQDLDRPKTEAAAARLASLNPDVATETVQSRLDQAGLRQWVEKSDVVLDCSDNFGTRFAVNEACVVERTPLVSGAAIRFEGQVSVFQPGEASSPCYRCLYDEAGETLENCAGSGIAGPVAGVVGSMMAMEAIKLLVGCGIAATGRLLLYDALAARWREIRIHRDPDCPVCNCR